MDGDPGGGQPAQGGLRGPRPAGVRSAPSHTLAPSTVGGHARQVRAPLVPVHDEVRHQQHKVRYLVPFSLKACGAQNPTRGEKPARVGVVWLQWCGVSALCQTRAAAAERDRTEARNVVHEPAEPGSRNEHADLASAVPGRTCAPGCSGNTVRLCARGASLCAGRRAPDGGLKTAIQLVQNGHVALVSLRLSLSRDGYTRDAGPMARGWARCPRPHRQVLALRRPDTSSAQSRTHCRSVLRTLSASISVTRVVSITRACS